MAEARNVAMVLTPPGAGAIAVVRILGPATMEFLRQHFSREARVGRCVHGMLRDGATEVDDPVVVMLPEARGADINLHGGSWVVRCALELARRAGFELIESSEAPVALEAVDGESLLEREAMAHLPLARTELGVTALLAQPQAWREFQQRFETMDSSSLQRIMADRALWWLLHPPRVAIVGAANVGKSTLANQLFAQERSITADVPGTTRDWVGEIANVNGLPIMLVDTPGQRETEDAIERQAIHQSRQKISEADLVVLVLDGSAALKSQSPLIASYPNALVVLNKADQPAAFDASAMNALPTVATSGVGVADLREKIVAHFGCEELDMHQPRWWTQRQRDCLERALEMNDPAADLLTEFHLGT